MKISEEKLVTFLEKEGLDAFYVHNPVNVRYICKYSGGDAYLLILKNKLYLLTDPRCLEHAEAECPEYDCVDWRPYGSIVKGLAEVLKRESIKKLGVEGEYVSCDMFEDIEKEYAKEAACEIVSYTNVIEDFQAVKEEEELPYIRNACEISERALERLYKDIRPGVTEKELEAKLAMYMAMEAADVKSCPYIVLSGARSAGAQTNPTMKAVEYGDPVLIDFGCKFDGYKAGITRTVIVGIATKKQKEIYQLVLDIQEKCIKAVKAGVKAKEIYKLAEDMVQGTGYEPYFCQTLGHGIGLFAHQRPYINAKSEDVLEENMVITIEPGICIPGFGGIRIGDELLVKKDGCVNLVQTGKQLLEVF